MSIHYCHDHPTTRMKRSIKHFRSVKWEDVCLSLYAPLPPVEGWGEGIK